MKKTALLSIIFSFIFLGAVCAPSGQASLYQSKDAGDNWGPIKSSAVKGEKPTDYPRNNIYSIAVDTTDHQVIYVGTQDAGLFKTTDGGIHWQRINNGLVVLHDGQNVETANKEVN